ncbi:MAG: D-2-hydroxyacid dehydrogenase [Dehalococcoidia bacterium]|nr:MAG: D-2-hydroxyacid dehydrogenase [Dehalococcoidia bacterium]
MSGLLLSRTFLERFGARLREIEAEPGRPVEHILIDIEAGPPPATELDRVELAFFSNDARYRRQPFIDALEHAPNLRWLQLFSVGVDPKAYPSLRARGVTITNAPGANAEAIAWTAMGAVIWLGRPFRHWASAQQRRAWDPIHYEDAPRDLAGQTMTILGVGQIGARVARHAHYLGMRVVGIRRHPSPNDPVEESHPPSALPAIVQRTDWLVVACPLTDETRGLVNVGLLSRLPRGAHLLNLSRGAVVVEEALIKALKSGQLGGAYVDVASQEPLPPESPLWDAPNLIVSPHNAAISASYPAASAECFFANLRRWRRGEPLEGVA